ncbi:MAG: MFS transporter [Proteobacteria bacterium]|nr:MFS transporter [Pseudomonadota bacterium]
MESRAGWTVAIASMLIMGIGFGTSYVVVVALKPIAAEMGSRSVPSLANALAYFGAGAGGIAAGWIADRIGVVAPALFGAVMVGTGAIVASGGGEWQLYLGHGLMIGLLGNAAMFAPLMANVSRWFDRNRGAALALVATGQQLAGAIWPPLFRYTIDMVGWRSTLFWYGVFAIASMVPLSMLLRRPSAISADQRATEPAPRGKVLGWPPNLVMALICLAIVCCCVAMAMPMSHVVAFCSDLGFSPARGAEMLSLLLVCAFISRMLWGRMSDRVGGLTTVLISSACQATFLALFLAADNLIGLYVVSAAFGFGFGGIVPSFLLSVRELFAEREAGWRMGAVVLGGLTGMALGAWLGGYVYDLTASYRPAFLAGVLFNLVNLVLVGTLLLRRAGGARLTPSLAASR